MGNNLINRVVTILWDSEFAKEDDKEALAKRILEKVWASEEFIEKAEENCREQGWSWPE